MTCNNKQLSYKEYEAIIIGKVQEVMQEDRFKNFLLSPDTLLAFRQEVLGCEPYSFNNRIILALFGARAVAGFKTWKSLGYYVRKGSKGLPIYKPLIVKPETGSEDVETEAQNGRLIGFRAIKVFDISQVEPAKGEKNEDRQKKVKCFFSRVESAATFCLELQGGNASLLDGLVSWVQKSVPVEFKDLQSGAKGMTNGQRIVVKAGMSSAQSVKTLLHENAHVRFGHVNSKLSKQAREVQAESAAFVAAHKLGLDTGAYTFDYLAAWGNDIINGKAGLDEFKELVQTAIEEGNAMVSEYQQTMMNSAA